MASIRGMTCNGHVPRTVRRMVRVLFTAEMETVCRRSRGLLQQRQEMLQQDREEMPGAQAAAAAPPPPPPPEEEEEEEEGEAG